MDRRRSAIMVAFAFVAFVVAATGHGRQLRAERESLGFVAMDPVSGWPEPMHMVWRADRAVLQACTAVAAVAGVVGALATGAGVGVAAVAALLWAPAMGFIGAAVAGMARAPAVSPSGAALLVVAVAALCGSGLLNRRRR